MFNTAFLLDKDDYVQDIYTCDTIISLFDNNVLVIPFEMYYIINANNIKPAITVIIGHESNIKTTHKTKYCNDYKACIKFLSSNYSDKKWWIIDCINMINDLIWNGAILDVFIMKSKNKMRSSMNKYDFNLLNNKSCQFKLETTNTETSTILKYSRYNHEEATLLKAMSDIIAYGSYRQNRTGVATYSTFGKQFEYKMIERIDPVTKKSMYSFPLLTTKKMFLRGIFAELKWFLSGQTDSKILESQNVNIWKGNSSREYLDSRGLLIYDEGQCGPIYGHQWRSWNATYDKNKKDHIGEGIDQVKQCIDSLKYDPFSRRHIISGWNVEQLDDMALPPCHVIYQFYVHDENDERYLSLSMYQRSGDTFLGIPFNICSMGLFLLMMAHQVGYKPYKLVHSVGDMHIYENHIDAVTKQLLKTPGMFPFVGISCETKYNIEDYCFDDIIIDGYISHNQLKADMVA